MKFFISLAISAAFFASSAIQAQEARSGTNVPDTLPSFRASVDPSREWPEPHRALRKGGAFILPAAILNVVPGMTKQQVYTLLDIPHFREGLFGEKTWDYVVNFYTGEGNASTSCQLQVHYDRHTRVDGVFWREQRCADFVEPKERPVSLPPEPAPVQAVMPAHSVRRHVFLFPFDSSDLRDVERERLGELAAEIVKSGTTRVEIIGMTDTSGSDRYNRALAVRRANSIAAGLRAAGAVSAQYLISASSDLAVPTNDEIKEPQNRRAVVILGQ